MATIKIPTVEEINKKIGINYSSPKTVPGDFVGPVAPGTKYAPLPVVKKQPTVTPKQVIKEVPSAAVKVSKNIFDFAKSIPQEIAKTALSVSMGVTGEKERDLSKGGPVQRKILGTKGVVKPIAQNAANFEMTLKDKGVKHGALPLAIAGTVGSAALDLIPGVGSGGKKIAKEAAEELAPKLLKSSKLISHEGAPDAAQVVKYLEDIKAGKKLDPLKVIKEGDKYGIEDGKHRFEAFQRAGVEDIPVEVVQPKVKVKVNNYQQPKIKVNSYQDLPVPRYKKAPDGKFAGSRSLIDNPQAGFVKVPETASPAAYNFGKNIPEPKIELPSNIRLDKFDLPDEGKNNLARIISENAGFGTQRRGVQTWKTTQELADSLGVNTKLKAGTALNAEELKALGDTVASLQSKLDDFSAKILTSAGDNSANKLAMAQTEEELNFALQSLSGATAESGRSLQIIRKIREAIRSGDDKLIDEALKYSDYGLGRKEIAKKFKELGDDAIAKMKFLRDKRKVKATDKIYEVWLNSILSNPLTHAVNSSSNTLKGVMKMPIRAVQAGFDKGVYLKEVPHQFVGALEGVTDGVKRALYVLKNGVSFDDVTKLELGRLPAIKGKTGEVVRLPTKMLTAADEFFKAIVSTSEMRSLAYRQARNEGLKGTAAIERMHKIISNPSKDLLDAVNASALEATFQQPLGKAGQALMTYRDKAPGLRYVIPFLKTPTNIAKDAFKTSPLGFLNVARKYSKGMYKNLPPNQMSEDLAKATIGSAIAVPVVFAALNGNITGAAPTNANERDKFYREGKQPYAIKIGNKWVSYRRIEPFATIMGTVADMTKVTDEKGLDKAALQIATLIGRNLNDKTFLSGVSNFIDAITDETKAEQWVNNVITGFDPFSGTQRFITRATDPTIRQPDGLKEAFMAQTPGLSQNVPPKLDAFGNAPKRTLSQNISPFGITQETNDSVEQELTRLRINFGPPSNSMPGGQDLTREEYRKFQEVAGPLTKNVLTEIISDPSWQDLNDRQKEQMINRTIDRIRERVKEKAFPLKAQASEIKKRLLERGYTSNEAERLTTQIINSNNK